MKVLRLCDRHQFDKSEMGVPTVLKEKRQWNPRLYELPTNPGAAQEAHYKRACEIFNERLK